MLVSVYESENTPEKDSLPYRGGHPSRGRQLQLGALAQLSALPTKACAREVCGVLQDYLRFMQSEGRTHARAGLQLSMAHLVDKHVENSKVRLIGAKYLRSPSLEEWTKGRVATSLLRHRVAEISDNGDPRLVRRLRLIMETACLPSLREMLRSPARIVRSADILSRLTDGKAEKLASFIESKNDWSDPQKYFLAYACVYRSLGRIAKTQPLSERDVQLVVLAKQLRAELAPKAKNVDKADQVLDSILQQYEARTNPKAPKGSADKEISREESE